MNIIKFVKLVIGSMLAIIFAFTLHLEYAYATGIITLLTIQDTKQETIIVAGKRLVIFFIMTLLSIFILPYFDYSPVSFFILMVPYLFICLYLDMKESIAPIAVLATHYITSKNCSITMIINELSILIIGAGIGILLNLFFQNNIKLVKQKQSAIDERMKSVFREMAFYIKEEDKTKYNGNCFNSLDKMLSDLRQESIRYVRNHFLKKNDYYYEYMQLRLSQCNLLKGIYTDINRINMVPSQAIQISNFLYTIADEFHETNNAISLLNRLQLLNVHYEQLPLPLTRLEFQNRAVLYHILKDLEEIVALKRRFMEVWSKSTESIKKVRSLS